MDFSSHLHNAIVKSAIKPFADLRGLALGLLRLRYVAPQVYENHLQAFERVESSLLQTCNVES